MKSITVIALLAVGFFAGVLATVSVYLLYTGGAS